jgi:hypothetical protein
MLDWVLEIISFNSQTCLISKEPKQRETAFWISYDDLHTISSLYKCTHWKYSVLNCKLTNKRNVRCTVLHTYVTDSRLNSTEWCDAMYRARGDKTGTSVCHAAATKLSAQYRQVLDRNLKHYLTICSPSVKHVSELKFISETQYNMR